VARNCRDGSRTLRGSIRPSAFHSRTDAAPPTLILRDPPRGRIGFAGVPTLAVAGLKVVVRVAVLVPVVGLETTVGAMEQGSEPWQASWRTLV
jgi:hypothetical protein